MSDWLNVHVDGGELHPFHPFYICSYIVIHLSPGALVKNQDQLIYLKIILKHILFSF